MIEQNKEIKCNDVIYEAKHLKLDTDCHVKVVKKSQFECLIHDVHGKFARLVKEIKVLERAKHSTLVHFYELLHDSKNLYLVTESIENNDLMKYILKRKQRKNMPAESDVKAFAAQILLAVKYLHE